MNEWSNVWCVVNWTDAHRVEDGVHHEVDGRKHFHIHDARHYQAQLGSGWEIWHWLYGYQAEEWVGQPSHLVNRNWPRMEKPENFTSVGTVPPDHDHSQRDPKDA